MEAGTVAARAAEAREHAGAEVRQRRDAAEAGRDRLELLDQQAREAGAEAARLQSERCPPTISRGSDASICGKGGLLSRASSLLISADRFLKRCVALCVCVCIVCVVCVYL